MKVSAKTDITIFSASFFTYYSTGQHWFSTFFRFLYFFDIRIIKNYVLLMFWRLGTMLERFFEAKSFGLHLSKPKKIPEIIFFYILIQKSVPQGAFWRITLYFEPESCPAGASWAKYLISCESKVACIFFEKKSQKALNHVLIG